MEKNEILEMAKKDNKNLDVADIEAQKSGAYIGYFVLGISILIVTIVDRLVLNMFDFGAIAACLLMMFTAFLAKYIKLRKKHELFVTLIYGAGAIFGLVCWILQLCKVW
ncbi:MAG: hypothetical protein J6Y28_08590 [Acholeplasmatales bacterium]|nr:hypothetical protein [Acholeplasmatales bacterium]